MYKLNPAIDQGENFFSLPIFFSTGYLQCEHYILKPNHPLYCFYLTKIHFTVNFSNHEEPCTGMRSFSSLRCKITCLKTFRNADFAIAIKM